MERCYETRVILQCALVKLYPEQFSIFFFFFFFIFKLYSSPAIFDLEIFEWSKGRREGNFAAMNNLKNLSIANHENCFCDSLVISQTESPLGFLCSTDGILESLIPRFAGIGIDLWFINGISLGSWFVTVVVASFSLVITRYCRWNQINPDWKSTRQRRSSITVVFLRLSHRSLIIPEFYDRLRANYHSSIHRASIILPRTPTRSLSSIDKTFFGDFWKKKVFIVLFLILIHL